jgi:hypothetical protein
MAIDEDQSPSEAATSPSPLARKIQKSKFSTTQAKHVSIPEENGDHGSNAEEGSSDPGSEGVSGHEGGENEEEEDEEDHESDESESDEEATGSEFNVDESEEGESEDDYIPKRRSSGGRKSQSGRGRAVDTTPKSKGKAQSSSAKNPPRILSGAAIAPNARDSKRHSNRSDMNHIERDIAVLAMDDDDMNDDSLVILPNKDVHKPAAEVGEESSTVSNDGMKKKKRYIVK